jgi:hypothetical protein
MNRFAFIAAPKLQTGCIAIISGALLGAVSAAAPAQSGDLYYPYEHATHRYGYDGCYRNCYPCSYYRCGCYRCNDCCGAVARPYPHVAVAERHWVERKYWERRYPISWPRYSSCGYEPCGYTGYPSYYGGHPNYYNGYPYYYGPRYSSAPPRPHLGFGGVQYPPAPISYEYDAPRPPVGAPYYTAGYFDEAPPRPPAGIPYYNAGYFDETSPRSPGDMPYYNAGYVE